MPKKYRVNISPEAEQDITSIHARIAGDKPQAADKWAKALRDQMLALDQFPERYEIIPEPEFAASGYRHIIFGNYRIFYRLEETRVLVVRVIDAGRRLLPHMLPEA